MSEAEMIQSDDQIRARAAALAEEIAAGLHQGRAAEWLEEVIGSALLDVARRERERCAAAAEGRVTMWQSSVRRLSSGTWPREAVAEARARLNEAIALVDALRVSIAAPPEG
jgi:hypothetical protein